MAAVTTAIAIGATVVSAGVGFASARQQRKQAAEARFIAGETAAENAIRRREIVAEREVSLAQERALSEIDRQREIRQRVNQARVAQAEQIAASHGLGFRGAAGQISADLSAAIGAARTQQAAEIRITESERRQQDIQTGLTPIEELDPNFGSRGGSGQGTVAAAASIASNQSGVRQAVGILAQGGRASSAGRGTGGR